MTTVTAPPWPAPLARGPVRATVTVPGSKSITNRALLLAALAGTGGTIRGALRSRDTDLMVGALRALGVPVTSRSDELDVAAHGGLRAGTTVDCGLAGTVMRFVPPLAALAQGPVRFDGDERARQRPMSAVLGALRALGCRVEGDALPFVLHGVRGRPGGEVRIDASGSSQFVSGLLLSAAGYDGGITVRHDGPPVPSRPHIEMTVQMLIAGKCHSGGGRESADQVGRRHGCRPCPGRAKNEFQALRDAGLGRARRIGFERVGLDDAAAGKRLRQRARKRARFLHAACRGFAKRPAETLGHPGRERKQNH